MQKENTSCAVSNINIHKETENKNKTIKDYYSFETGVVSTENVINSYLKIDSILKNNILDHTKELKDFDILFRKIENDN